MMMQDLHIEARDERHSLKSFEVVFCSASMRTHGEEICGIRPTTHGQRFTRVHRVAVYSLHFDALTKEEAMTIDAVISQADVVEFILDYFSEKGEDEDPFRDNCPETRVHGRYRKEKGEPPRVTEFHESHRCFCRFDETKYKLCCYRRRIKRACWSTLLRLTISRTSRRSSTRISISPSSIS